MLLEIGKTRVPGSLLGSYFPDSFDLPVSVDWYLDPRLCRADGRVPACNVSAFFLLSLPLLAEMRILTVR